MGSPQKKKRERQEREIVEHGRVRGGGGGGGGAELTLAEKEEAPQGDASPDPHHHHRPSVGLVVGRTVGAVALLFAVAIVVGYLRVPRRRGPKIAERHHVDAAEEGRQLSGTPAAADESPLIAPSRCC